MKVSMGPPPPRKHNPENPNSDPSKECQTLAEVARPEVADVPAEATAGECSPLALEPEEKVDGVEPAPDSSSPTVLGPEERVDGVELAPDCSSPTALEPEEKENKEKVDDVDQAPDSSGPKRQSSAVPYSIPPWSETPEHPFFVEVLKDGAIVEQLNVSKKGAYMFGRIDLCDFVLEHPSISRFHAVLQFKQNEVFLFDIGSTHGTFINKKQVKTRAYVEVHVGDVIRFGSSSRLYVFQGPTELMPPEGNLEKIRNAKFRQETLDREASLLRAKVEATLADGISWGLSEDAIEESTENDEDEVTWQTYRGQLTEKQEKTRGKVLKRMEKIANMRKEIDAIRAKDIAQGGLTQGQQTQIARNEQRMTQIMEELESLEETLNESIQESLGARSGKLTHKTKRAIAEDEDDIPSDDDDFYDRTKKMSAQLSAEKSSVETAETLLIKKESIISQIEEKKVLLKKEQEKAEVEAQKGNNVDDLDAYMAGLSSQLVHDKIGKIQNDLSGLRSELDKIMYLLKFADPTGEGARKRELESQASVLLPSPKTHAPVSKPDDAGKCIKSDPNPARGKQMTTTKTHAPPVSEPDDAGKCIKPLQQGEEGKSSSQVKNEVPVYAPTKPQWLGATRSTDSDENKMDHTHVEENESDNFVDYKDRNQALASKVDRPEIERAGPGLIIRKRKLVDDADTTTDTRGSKFKESTSQQDADTSVADAVALLMKHKRGYSALDGVMDEDEQSQTDNAPEKDTTQPKRVLGPSRPDFLAGKPDYESWMPPEGQTGDGRTSLNDRLGY